MKARRNLTIAAAVAALIPLGVAVAGDNDQYGSKSDKMSHASFSKLDTNKDGRISQSEAAADPSITFSSADTNGDGYLDKNELKAARKGSNEPQSRPQSRPQDSTMPPSNDPSNTDPRSMSPDGVPPSGDRMPDTETPRQ